MRASEFILEDGTVSGDVTPVVMPLGTMQRRAPLSFGLDKYPNKIKKVKGNARRRSKNTTSN